MKRITPEEIIKLVKELPDVDMHIHEFEGKQCITQEWLCGGFAGRSFEDNTLEGATEMMLNYFYSHIGHDSLVGYCLKASGFPDLKKVKEYCLSSIDSE